jgi:hypothetical protein
MSTGALGETCAFPSRQPSSTSPLPPLCISWPLAAPPTGEGLAIELIHHVRGGASEMVDAGQQDRLKRSMPPHVSGTKRA